VRMVKTLVLLNAMLGYAAFMLMGSMLVAAVAVSKQQFYPRVLEI